MFDIITTMEKGPKNTEKQTGIYLKPELGDGVRMLAAARKTSKSQIVNDALKEYFTNHAVEIRSELQGFIDRSVSNLSAIESSANNNISPAS